MENDGYGCGIQEDSELLPPRMCECKGNENWKLKLIYFNECKFLINECLIVFRISPKKERKKEKEYLEF